MQAATRKRALEDGEADGEPSTKRYVCVRLSLHVGLVVVV